MIMTLESSRINWGKLLSRILLYFVVVLISLFILYPYFVMFTTALKSRNEIFAMDGRLFPVKALWSNFADIWVKAPMAKYMVNFRHHCRRFHRHRHGLRHSRGPTPWLGCGSKARPPSWASSSSPRCSLPWCC